MHRLRVHAAAVSLDALALDLVDDVLPQAGPDEVVVEVRAAGVNPSDVKAALGAMPHAVWPRTPGRDWAGVVVDGPQAMVGLEMFGSAGDLGIRRDGTHARYLRIPRAAAVAKPTSISLDEAGAVGVPFVTAWEGFRKAGMPVKGDVVLVLGANGKVGQAAMQIGAMRGARVFGVTRTAADHADFAGMDMRMIDASSEEIAGVVKGETGSHGADIVVNTVGSPYFAAANAASAIGARHVFMSTLDRAVPFDIFAFYRAQLTYVGIDTLALDCVQSAAILRELAPGFQSGALKPYPVLDSCCYPLDRAGEAYRAVLSGSRDRVVLRP